MLDKLRVLVVEDEILIARCLCDDLINIGIVPIGPVPRGELAIKKALTEKPNLILMDIRLAGSMDGIEAAKMIQKIEDIPILFMTGYATDHIKKKVEAVKYIDLLFKPITIEQLIPYFTNIII